jgi:hypothetical protein
MRLPLAIGAVVEGSPTTFHTPLSGHDSPVLAVVPIGILLKTFFVPALRVETVSLLNSYCRSPGYDIYQKMAARFFYRINNSKVKGQGATYLHPVS